MTDSRREDPAENEETGVDAFFRALDAAAGIPAGWETTAHGNSASGDGQQPGPHQDQTDLPQAAPVEPVPLAPKAVSRSIERMRAARESTVGGSTLQDDAARDDIARDDIALGPVPPTASAAAPSAAPEAPAAAPKPADRTPPVSPRHTWLRAAGILAFLGLGAFVATHDWKPHERASANLSYEQAFDYAMSAKEPDWEVRNTATVRIASELSMSAKDLHKVIAKGHVKSDADALLADYRDWLKPRKGRQNWSQPTGEMAKTRAALTSPLSTEAERRRAIRNLQALAKQGFLLLHDVIAVGGKQGAQATKMLRMIKRSAR